MQHPEGPATAPPLGMDLRINFSIMMFLQFAIWGAWFVNLGNFAKALGFEDYIGHLFATMPIGAIVSSMFVGQVADRYFSSERLMAFLHLVGAALLFWMASISEANLFYWVALAYALVYSPTLSLSNSIAFTHLPDATRDFPGIRVSGTIGWIAAGFLVTALLGMLTGGAELAGLPAPKYSMLLGGMRLTVPLVLAAVLSLVLGVQCLFLPHTPPTGKAGDSIPFLRAVALMKEFSFAVFYGVSFIITIALAFYYAWTGPYLEGAQGVEGKNVTSVMAIGQLAEMLLLPLLPIFLQRWGMKWVLAIGMLAWGVRYGLFALGTPYAFVLVGIALHGVCFDFFLAAGFIHVDNKAPREIRASAQALFGFLTYGAGMWIGSLLSGWSNKYYTNPVTQVVDWRSFWIGPSVVVLISLVIFVSLFRDNMRGNKPAADA